MELFGSKAYLQAVDGGTILEKKQQTKAVSSTVPVSYYPDFIAYLEAFLNGRISDSTDLSSLSNNLLVVEILEAATRSAKEGKKIRL
jgi:predicted dehydrogenase